MKKSHVLRLQLTEECSGQKKVPVPFSYYDRVTIDRVNKNGVATHTLRYDRTYSVPF